MGQAKQRGTREQRIAQARAKIDADRPAKIVCNSCSAEVGSIDLVDTKGLRGIEGIWMGRCECGHITFAAAGEPQAVQAFFDALDPDSELLLGSQSKDGGRHENF